MELSKLDLLKRFHLPLSLEEHSHFVHLKQNEYLFEPGSYIDKVYYIVTGTLIVFKPFADGTIRRMVYLGPNEPAGEFEAFSGKTDTEYAVQAFEPTLLLRIDGQKFLEKLKQDKEALYSMVQLLTSKIYTVSGEMTSHIQNNAVGTLGLFIVNCVTKQFSEDKNLHTYTIKHTRPQISDACLISERSVNRSIKYLQEKGFIAINKGKIVVSRSQFERLLKSDFITDPRNEHPFPVEEIKE